MGQRTGLDYGAVQAVLQALHPRAWKGLFRGIRVVERALLTVDAQQSEAAHDDPH